MTDPVQRHPAGYWTEARCVESAAPFKTPSEWEKAYSGAHYAARKNGWLPQCTAHMESPQPRPREYWTEARCMKSAAPFNTPSEWHRAPGGSYAAAQRMGWLPQCTAHMTLARRPNGYWTEARCVESAAPFKAVGEWQRACPGAHKRARAEKWLPKCTVHMEKRIQHPKGTLTLDYCMESAAPFNTPSEWQKADSGAYQKAWKNREEGWYSKCTAHMTPERRPNGTLTLDYCKADALKYTSRNEWFLAPGGAYGTALANGWLPQCTAHMPRLNKEQSQRTFARRLRSVAPRNVEIREGVRGILPSRLAALDMVAYRDGEPFLAVEYCGVHWHSDHPKYGKREKDYHEQRRRQCETQGIRLIHVWEDEADNPALLDMIEEAVGAFRPILFAEECTARDLADDEAVTFYAANHIHGAADAATQTFHRGLVHDGEVVAAVSYVLHDGDADWRLVRFAKKLGWRVEGALDALLTFGSILTEVDMDIFDGADLKAAGFVRVGVKARFSRVEKGLRVENYKGNPPGWFKLWHCETAILISP